MITPTITNLLKLPLETGMSHLVKATFGSLIVSGCGFRYQGTPHNTSQYRTSLSLRTGADLYGGIFTPVDMYRYVFFFVLLVHSFFPALRGTPFQPKPKGIGRSLPLDPAQSILADFFSHFHFIPLITYYRMRYMNIAYCDNLIIYYEYVALLPLPRWRNGHAIACRAIPIRFDSGPWLLFSFIAIWYEN